MNSNETSSLLNIHVFMVANLRTNLLKGDARRIFNYITYFNFNRSTASSYIQSHILYSTYIAAYNVYQSFLLRAQYISVPCE